MRGPLGREARRIEEANMAAIIPAGIQVIRGVKKVSEREAMGILP
jgi:hypothetical protein